jgi:hypothetical protein
MNIVEAIKHCKEVSNSNCGECGKEHQQLAIWLQELVDLKEKKMELIESIEYIKKDGSPNLTVKIGDVIKVRTVKKTGYGGLFTTHKVGIVLPTNGFKNSVKSSDDLLSNDLLVSYFAVSKDNTKYIDYASFDFIREIKDSVDVAVDLVEILNVHPSYIGSLNAETYMKYMEKMREKSEPPNHIEVLYSKEEYEIIFEGEKLVIDALTYKRLKELKEKQNEKV